MKGSLQELLRYSDRNSMAHSREVRLPFLYHNLVEFVFTLPSRFKINSGFTKFVLRKALENRMPSTIVWRKDKVGYEPPDKNSIGGQSLSKILIDAYRLQ
jgi:asparagine synthase (glutamine-hydrolysing)